MSFNQSFEISFMKVPGVVLIQCRGYSLYFFNSSIEHRMISEKTKSMISSGTLLIKKFTAVPLFTRKTKLPEGR